MLMGAGVKGKGGATMIYRSHDLTSGALADARGTTSLQHCNLRAVLWMGSPSVAHTRAARGAQDAGGWQEQVQRRP